MSSKYDFLVIKPFPNRTVFNGTARRPPTGNGSWHGEAIKRLVRVFRRSRHLDLITPKEKRIALLKANKRAVKRSKRLIRRYGILAGNIALIFMVGFFVWQSQTKAEDVLHTSSAKLDEKGDVTGPIDSISAADIATNVAYAASLPQLGAVSERALAVSYQGAFSTTEDIAVAKPQIITGGSVSRKDIKNYTVKSGDTVSSIAAAFNVTSDSIRWSNDLTGDNLKVGSSILVPPQNSSGIVYKVKSGDTPESLADKYKTSKEKIITFNDAEVSGLPVGEYILIPDGKIQQSFYATSTSYFFGPAVFSAGNGYTPGQCTYGAAAKRAEMGMPIPSNWGSAYTWDDAARSQGYRVDQSPEVGAIMQSDGWTPTRNAFYIYHVGVVVGVDDQNYYVYDMNYSGPWSVRTYAAYPKSSAQYYNFIH